MGNLFPDIHAAGINNERLPTPNAGNSGTAASTRCIADELPYLSCGYFDGFGPLHLLADDTIGFAFSVPIPAVDTTPDAEQSVSEAIVAMLHALTPDVQWQWFLCADNNVENALRRYQKQGGTDPTGSLFCAAFVERWRTAQCTGFFPGQPEHDFHPRSQKITIALKSGPLGLARRSSREIAEMAIPKRWAHLRKFLSQPGSSSDACQRIGRFVSVARDVIAAAQSHQWQTTLLDADALALWVGAMLFPQRAREAFRESLGLDFLPFANETRSAVAAMGRIENVTPGGFETVAAGVARHHRLVSMLWQPRTVFPGMLNSLVHLRPIINVGIAASTQGSARTLLQLKARALLNARSTNRFNETEMQARNAAFQEVEQRLFADGERIFDLRLHVHVCEPTSEEADMAAGLVCRHLERLEMESAPECDIGSSLLLRGCLPFAIYRRSEQKFHRRRRMLSRDCADLHPGGGCWTGAIPDPESTPLNHPRPTVMYSNSMGEPLFIDPTAAEKNPHALIIGQSGSGKSFFVHDYLLHLWRLPDVRLFLISIKADYRKLALLLGRYVEVKLDSEISLNPFVGAPTRENQARWYAALELMLTEGCQNLKPPRETEVLLQTAALAAAQRNWNTESNTAMRETVLEDICVELERDSGVLGRQLSGQLHPYRRGPYRKLFNAPRGSTLSERFIFFNLGNILRQPCAALASFCVFGLVDETMNDPTLRAVPKGLIADEVWALVRNTHAAAILERSLKAYRSLGGFAVPIVQDPKDLDTPSGRVMLVNTATKILLPMDATAHEDIQNYVRLNEREMEIVRNLRLAKRRFSEFFISIDGMRSAKGLLIPDPLRYAVATTDPVDEHRIEAYFQECGDMLVAVERFAKDMPYGLPAPDTVGRRAAGISAGVPVPGFA